MSKKKGQRVSNYQNRKRRRKRKNQDRLEHRKRLQEDSREPTQEDHKVDFHKQRASQELAHHNKIAPKCSTAKSAEEFVERLNTIGDRLNVHHIYPQSRIGAFWEITQKGFITHEWNELKVSERKHVCLNVLFETATKIRNRHVTISRTPQEIYKQIELWGDASGEIDFSKLNTVQLVAWCELFGRGVTVKDAIDLIKKEWDIQPKWQNVCKNSFLMLRVRKCGSFWLVHNDELKLAVAIVSARYRKESIYK